MKIDHIRVYNLSLPFSFSFSHAAKDRSSARNVVVELEADRGEIRGYGEGAPRRYVTGETQEKAARDLERLMEENRFPWHLEEVSQIWDYVDGLPADKGSHAVICALETAMLDALGRREGKPVTDYFPHAFYHDTVKYGSAVPLASREKVMKFCRRTREMNIRRLKLKLGKSLEESRAALQTVAVVFGNEYDLKVDANMAWNYDLALNHLLLLKTFMVKVVEQPMRPGDPDIERLSHEMQSQGMILMADESACSFEDLEQIMKNGYYRMINIRLSKCGGFRRSLKMIDFLRSRGAAFQIGCHVGESGILSAAGRALSLLSKDAVYHDGSYDAFLLQENVTREDVSFGSEGKARALGGPGLGVDIDRKRLIRLSGGSPASTISRP